MVVLVALAVSMACGGGDGELRVVCDLGERAPFVRSVDGTPRVRFGEVAERARLGKGWGHLERGSGGGPGFVWAVATAAELELLRTEYDRVRFRCLPFSAPGLPPQRVALEVNGIDAGSVVLGHAVADYELALPSSCLRRGPNLLLLRFDHAESPASRVPGSGDRRTLAAAFEWLELAGGVEAKLTARVLELGVPEGGVVEVDGKAPPLAELWVATGQGEPEPVHPRRAGWGRTTRSRYDLSPWAGQVVQLWFVAPAGPSAWPGGRLLGRPGAVDLDSNLLLVVVDTLRGDALGCSGSSAVTPVMDGVAARGARFETASSHVPITGPSHATLFCSSLPFEHGVLSNAQVLPEEVNTLAEVMRAWHRRTAAVVSLGVLKAEFGFDQGFERYDGSFSLDWWKDAAEVTDRALEALDDIGGEPFFLWVHYSDPHEPYAPPGLDYPRVRVRAGGKTLAIFAVDGRTVSVPFTAPPGRTELRFELDGPGSGRRVGFFDMRLRESGRCRFQPGDGWWQDLERVGPPKISSALPASVAVDNPESRPVGADLRFYAKEILSVEESRQRYAGEVEHVDRQLGRLLEALRSRGLEERTLVVVLGDHGEGLGQHHLLGHIVQVYDSLLRVPLILSWPGRMPAGLTVAEPVGLEDVKPTLLELLGLPRPGGLRGRSLVPLLAGGDVAARPLVAATFRPEAPADLEALVEGGFKLILTRGEEPAMELYDLERDPGELHDLAPREPERVAAMRAELERLVAEARGRSAAEAESAELSEEDLARMRALGYVR